jgi:hypothetical protein
VVNAIVDVIDRHMDVKHIEMRATAAEGCEGLFAVARAERGLPLSAASHVHSASLPRERLATQPRAFLSRQ